MEILYNAGFESSGISDFVGRNIDENLEMLSGEESSEVEEAAEQVVAGMLDFRNSQSDEMKEEE